MPPAPATSNSPRSNFKTLDSCGYTATIPGELNLPQVLDLPGGWKILTPRQARKQRLVTKAHAKLPDKEVGVS